MPLSFGVCIATIIIAAVLAIAGMIWTLIELFTDEGRHAAHKTADPGPLASRSSGPGIGSMQLSDELLLVDRGGITYTDDHGTVVVRPWDPPHGLDGPGFDGATVFYNGHTLTCLRPGEDHPGACPEKGDWPDDYDWPVPDLPAPEPVAAGPALVAIALASAEEDPADAGWTDQLLADLHDAPTVLDQQPRSYEQARTDMATMTDAEWEASDERRADTGEIELASIRADYAAEIRAADADVAEYLSRMRSDAAEYQIAVGKR